MIKRSTLKNTWIGMLLLFAIISLAYSNQQSGVFYSPIGMFNNEIVQMFFAVFVVGAVLILTLITILLYFIHRDLDE